MQILHVGGNSHFFPKCLITLSNELFKQLDTIRNDSSSPE